MIHASKPSLPLAATPTRERRWVRGTALRAALTERSQASDLSKDRREGVGRLGVLCLESKLAKLGELVRLRDAFQLDDGDFDDLQNLCPVGHVA